MLAPFFLSKAVSLKPCAELTNSHSWRSMRFMVKSLLIGVGLLWLVAGAAACGQSGAVAGQEAQTVAKKSIEQVLKEHTDSLMALPGVVGTGQGLCGAEPCIRVFVVEATQELLEQIPDQIEGYTVDVQQTGEFKALDSS